MTDFSKGAQKIAALFKGNETERMLTASVLRTILADMIRLYFENRKASGKGCLVFNPMEPTASRYITVVDIQSDLAIAEEAMDENIAEMFKTILRVIEKEDNEDIAIVAMIDDEGMHIHLLDPNDANERINEAANQSGLIF